MSHPKNKRERFLYGERKGRKRVRQWFVVGESCKTIDEVKELTEKFTRIHRNITKICNGVCCANPRKYFKEVTLQERKFAEKQRLLDFKAEGTYDGKDTSISRKNTN